MLSTPSNLYKRQKTTTGKATRWQCQCGSAIEPRKNDLSMEARQPLKVLLEPKVCLKAVSRIPFSQA